jgi:hypothetical protein
VAALDEAIAPGRTVGNQRMQQAMRLDATLKGGGQGEPSTSW